MAFLPSSVMLGNNYRKDGIADYFKDTSSNLVLEKIVELKNMPENDMETMIRELREQRLPCGFICKPTYRRKYCTTAFSKWSTVRTAIFGSR